MKDCLRIAPKEEKTQLLSENGRRKKTQQNHTLSGKQGKRDLPPKEGGRVKKEKKVRGGKGDETHTSNNEYKLRTRHSLPNVLTGVPS